MSGKKLLNNELMHDVVFLVGQSKTKMYGHKLFLIVHNEFFNTLLNIPFADSEKGEFPIADVEPAIFLELLRFIYCETANVTCDNFYQIYQAADKYLMEELKSFCNRHLTESNATKIYIDNFNNIKFPELEKSCKEIIWSNPIDFFKDEQFCNIPKSLLEYFCENYSNWGNRYCSYFDVLSAINQWFDEKEMDFEIQQAFHQQISLRTRFVSFRKSKEISIERERTVSIRLRTLVPCTLFGLVFTNERCNNNILEIKTYDKAKLVKSARYTIECELSQDLYFFYFRKIRLEQSQEIEFKCYTALYYELASNVTTYFELEPHNDTPQLGIFDYLLIECED